MKASLIRNMVRWAWAWVPLGGLVVLLIATGITSEAQVPAPGDNRADPAQFSPGKLNAQAVADAKSFQEFPILWLGEEFKGYKLTSIARTNVFTPANGPFQAIHDNRISLVYGDCKKDDNDWGCTPPLSIIIWAPGSIPELGDIPEEVKGESGPVRGLRSAIVSESTVLWADDGVAIQIHSNDDIRDDIVAALQLANAKSVGLPEIKANQTLNPLNHAPRMAPTQTPSRPETP